MAEAQLIIKYDGGDAAKHTVEMRALGLSLIGFERIVSDGLIFMGHNRLPKRRERHELAVKARELHGNSVRYCSVAPPAPAGMVAHADGRSGSGQSLDHVRFCETLRALG